MLAQRARRGRGQHQARHQPRTGEPPAGASDAAGHAERQHAHVVGRARSGAVDAQVSRSDLRRLYPSQLERQPTIALPRGANGRVCAAAAPLTSKAITAAMARISGRGPAAAGTVASDGERAGAQLSAALPEAAQETPVGAVPIGALVLEGEAAGHGHWVGRQLELVVPYEPIRVSHRLVDGVAGLGSPTARTSCGGRRTRRMLAIDGPIDIMRAPRGTCRPISRKRNLSSGVTAMKA